MANSLTPLPPLPSESLSPTKPQEMVDTVPLLLTPVPPRYAFLRVSYALLRCGIVGEVALRAAVSGLLGPWQLCAVLAALVLPVDVTSQIVKRIILAIRH